MTRRLVIALLLLVPVAAVAGDNPKPKRAWLGVMIGLDKEKEGKIVILTVFPDSPAQKAKLEVGDILVRINGAKPEGLQAAVKVIGALKPGKKARLEIIRDGKARTIEAVPEERE